MDENLDKDQDRIDANWLTNWEDQCIQDWENETNMDDKIQNESERSAQKLWLSFQNSATAIAQLYRDRCNDGTSMWVPFQNSASGVTIMYKDSLDVMKKSFELGIACGHHRRNRDMLNWVKKRRRHIRREDLIAYLCGKNAPVRARPPSTLGWAGARVVDRATPRLPSVVEAREENDGMTDLQPFRDALALQRLNGAMSNISMGFQSCSPAAASTENIEANQRAEPEDDFHCFILDEMSRRCDNSRKRTPSSDVRMDSPTRKRSRLL